MSLFKRVLNAGEGRKLKLLQSIVPEINALEPDMERLSDAELQGQTAEFRRRFERGEDLDDLLAEAGGELLRKKPTELVRRAARRVRDDQPDGPRGIALRRGARVHGGKHAHREPKPTASYAHDSSLGDGQRVAESPARPQCEVACAILAARAGRGPQWFLALLP